MQSELSLAMREPCYDRHHPIPFYHMLNLTGYSTVHASRQLWKAPEFVTLIVTETLFQFVLVDPDFLHSNWLTGVVHETMHHVFEP